MQKFHHGDWVHVAKDLGKAMSHFASDCEAIVIGSYADKYGGSDRDSFTLHIKGEGECSWYYGSQLEIIEKGRLDKLKEWKKEEEDKRKQESDLDWIFLNSDKVLARASGHSIQALAEVIGVKDLWGNNGEGITYFFNSMIVLRMAEPYLKQRDKDGWVNLGKSIKQKMSKESNNAQPQACA